jgi:CRISPR system Cascade subunit CasE
MTLYLHRIVLKDPAALHRFGRDHVRDRTGRGLPDHPFDPGYMVHVLLKGLFGDLAPAVFFQDRLGVLGYALSDESTMRRRAQETALPEVFSSVDWSQFTSKQMPESWPPEHRLGFKVRVCPVVRGPKGHGAVPGVQARKEDPEVDAYLARLWRDPSCPAREEVYREWLDGQFRQLGGAVLESGRLVAFQLTRLLRRTQDVGEGRIARGLTRPDATFEGCLQVQSSDLFNKMLARGLGRHRAFGFGLLLLRPL